MEITDFKESHVEEAAAISFRAWGEEFADREFGRDFVRLVYLSTVRFYRRDGDYSFAASKDGRLKGFLLGFPAGTPAKTDFPETALNQKEKTVLRNYLQYLEDNDLACRMHAGANSAVIGLIASEEKGAGRLLAERFEKKCADSGKEEIILWADVTCGYGFYEKTGYETAEIFHRTDYDGQSFKTYIFKKRLIR